jgi:hypothetical protein
MVDFGFGQGRKSFETVGVVRLRRGFQKIENAGRGRKMPFMDGHYLSPQWQKFNSRSREARAFHRTEMD